MRTLLQLKIFIALTLLCLFYSDLSYAQTDKGSKAMPAIVSFLLQDDFLDDSFPPDIENINTLQTIVINSTPSPITFNNIGGTGLTSCTVSPALPAGLSVQVSSNGRFCEIVGTPTTLSGSATFTVTATNVTDSDTATVNIEVVNNIVISGFVKFERINTTTSPTKLDYSSPSVLPARKVRVELLDASNNQLSITSTDNSGNYSFTLNNNQAVRVRVRAELVKTTPGEKYDVKVVNNTNNYALYALAEASANLASTNTTRNFLATSGWGGSSYTSARLSAPYALLDSIYEAMSDFIAIKPNIDFPPLLVNWSVNNKPAPGNNEDGNIGTSFYTNGNIYILGQENSDTDEFDDHVVIHEWGHYFEDKLARSDSIGGRHGGGDRLDMRVAFGEGFGNALSGIITDDPLYVDTFGAQQSLGFFIDVDQNTVTNPGWYSEFSVQSILYDLYDSNPDVDDKDHISLGLKPIADILMIQQKNTEAFTSIFSFIDALKTANPSQIADINTLVNAQSINSTSIEPFGSTETNNAGTSDVFPIYSDITPNGASVNLCTITDFNSAQDNNNKLSNRRYLKFDVPSTADYVITVNKTSSAYGSTDPDFVLYKAGEVKQIGVSATVDSETTPSGSSKPPALEPGLHILEFTDYNIRTGSRGKACFDVTVTSN